MRGGGCWIVLVVLVPRRKPDIESSSENSLTLLHLKPGTESLSENDFQTRRRERER
jgi:hypothetical protein